ncbi:hypothetical protein JQX13_12430 [Archangium violaceum]|uniref:hypothetical protein n=1 Tax=Archangium violaceum TaxID=83451 RepID=UPI00193AE415|nr:hypothetical protein [Archangium violaceum]QRK10798.1 hypothetical protein JQX13_12430 [Archangium violaceum]
MGEWGQATFFRTNDLDALERAIRDLCSEEGLVAAPYVRRERETWDRMQYGTGATSDRWALALGASRGGWSVVKTAPLDLLAKPGPSGEHRLGIIARALRCDALHVSLQDGTAMVMAQREEHPGDFQHWAREVSRAPRTVDDRYSRYDLPMLWAGPHAVVVADASAGTSWRTDEGETLAVLDRRTKQRRPLFDAAGLEPLAFSASGSRCLARAGTRRLFVGSIGYERA